MVLLVFALGLVLISHSCIFAHGKHVKNAQSLIICTLFFLSRGSEGLPRIPPLRVQRGEHPLLAGLRGPQAGAQPRAHRGEGAHHLRGLRLHTLAKRGEWAQFGRSETRDWSSPVCLAGYLGATWVFVFCSLPNLELANPRVRCLE